MTFEPPGDLSGFLEGMQQLQRDLVDAQAAATSTAVVGSAGGGLVTVSASGELSFDEVRIDASVLVDADAGLIEDLVLAAIRDAASKLLDARQAAMGNLMSGALGSILGGTPPPASEIDGPPAGGDAAPAS